MYCLVTNGAFDRRLPANKNVDWDANTTLPPSALTAEQRTKFGVYFFIPGEAVPARHQPRTPTYDIGVDTVTETIPAVPFSAGEVAAEKEELIQNQVDQSKFFKAFALVAAEQWSMTPAQLKAAIKAKL